MKRETSVLLRELRRLSEATHDARAELLVAAGIEAIDRRVLDALARGSGGATARTLALALLCPAATIEASLSRLRSRRWVDELATEGGPPGTHALTLRGRRWLRELQREECTIDGLFEDETGLEELRRATRLLRAARRRLVGRQGRRARPFVAGRESLASAGDWRGKLETCSSDALSATASAA